MAIWAAAGRAASHGVLIYHGDALQRLAAVRAIYFDKTGTLTTSQATLMKFIADKPNEADDVLQHSNALALMSQRTLHARIATGVLDPLARFRE
jgi:P-type E1-E2 ATPase